MNKPWVLQNTLFHKQRIKITLLFMKSALGNPSKSGRRMTRPKAVRCSCTADRRLARSLATLLSCLDSASSWSSAVSIRPRSFSGPVLLLGQDWVSNFVTSSVFYPCLTSSFDDTNMNNDDESMAYDVSQFCKLTDFYHHDLAEKGKKLSKEREKEI